MAAARVTTTPSQGEGGHGNGGGGHGNGGGGHGNGEGGHGNGDGGFSGEGPGPAQEERLCSHFVAITGCPQEAARAALQASAWALDRALDSYFEPPEDPRHTGGSPSPPAAPEVCVDLTDDSPTGASGSAHRGKREDDSTFSIICWNVDGLDPNNLSERARAVCSYLTLYSPAVVFLQEVIPAYYSYLKKRATNYTIIPGCEDGYFTVIMLKKSSVKFISREITPFPETKMLRNLLSVKVNILGNELYLLTSHLESTKDSSTERVNQLRIVWRKMQEMPESATVIFGGDTNLRDSEVSKVGGLPGDILDIWEFLGKPEYCRYTWDTQANCNLRIRSRCKFRFDRLFFRAAAQGGHVLPRSLDLLGMEKLDCGRFPSDHWGLLCNFDVIL
ncbi:tyrosyl-DNA phosphodiesterase 2 isoform X1 [Tachyglossus aculeatus]|uniref:tyrosyl-DNA phosphodiesterase 2 isoform X1 n=1 Tax=Tachyglossus aculeatus TaxID=9261 RepID=UPI0018F3784B|nr:tyrosyl-DNA phosphodiesterase 2 isoform X1 [Tachyglossus aculeatus]